MNDFNIQDAQLLLEQAGDLAQINQNILRVKEDIYACYSEINKAWQSDTVDKASYLDALVKNLEKIEVLCSAIFSLSHSLTSFGQQAINTANNG